MMLALFAFVLASASQVAAGSAQHAPAAQPDVATPDDAKSRIELAEKLNGLHGMKIPWHLKASYEVFTAEGTTSDKGTYEEWRVSENQYRLALHSPSLSVEEYGTDHGVFRTGQLDWPREPLSSITGIIARPIFPHVSEETEYENYQRSLGAGKLPCTAVKKRGRPSTPASSPCFCFSRSNAVLLYASTPNAAIQTLF